MEEVFHAAAVVLGEPLPSHLATSEQILKSTERNTGGRPSMLVDWEKGARLELEVILGNPIRIARASGVEMPRLQSMYSLLGMAQRRRDEEREKNKRESASPVDREQGLGSDHSANQAAQGDKSRL
jgi:2-dehydropantoate 2-reductase